MHFEHENNMDQVEKDLRDQIEQGVEEDDTQSEELVDEVVEEVEDEIVDDAEDDAEELAEEEDDVEAEEVVETKADKSWAKMRIENKEKDSQIQELKEMVAKIQGAQEAMQSMQKPEVVEANPEPDKEIYPEEHQEWRINKLTKQLEEQSAASTQMQERLNVQDQINGIKRLESEYSSDNPEYDAAVKFLSDQESMMIKLQYPDATDSQISQHLAAEKLKMFQSNPHGAAAAIKAMADARGFTNTPAKKSNLGNLKKNIKKNQNVMGGTGANASGTEITPEQVFNMTMDDVTRMSNKQFEATVAAARRKG